MHETDLKSVTTTDLLKFLASIMPRDFISLQAPQITYVSNVPRELIPPVKVESLPSPEENKSIYDSDGHLKPEFDLPIMPIEKPPDEQQQQQPDNPQL